MTDDHEPFRLLRRRTPAPRPETDAVVVGSSLVTPVAVLLFATSVVLDWPAEAQLATLAVGVSAFLVGFRRYFAAAYPQVEAAEPRPPTQEEPVEVREIMPHAEQRMLRRALMAAAASLGLAALVPISSLGPRYRPPTTGWAGGVRLVTADGDPIRPEELGPAGVAMVWPEDVVRAEHGMAILVRLLDDPQPPTRSDWVVDGRIVAYSRVCTHTGCAIGTFRETDSAVYCPCHQAQFDLRRGAEPTFGPASRPLPQLPLGVGADGYLVALGDFTQPVGPPRG